MDNPFQQLKKQLAQSCQRSTPFGELSDHEIATGVVSTLLAVPTDRVRKLVETKRRSTSRKDQYEARELATVLFVQDALLKLPESVSAEEGNAIMKETVQQIFENLTRK